MFLGLHKLGNICCGHEMFLNKIRNIFCVRNECCARGQTGKHLCPQQCVLVCQGLNSPAFTGTQNPSFVYSIFLPDRPTHLHEREGDGKRNILLGWPGWCRLFSSVCSAVWLLKSVNPKISRIGRQKQKNEFFLIWPKESIWLPVFGNEIKRFDFLFFSSKFAKLENSATGPSAAAMRLEIWHMFNMLVWTYQPLS